MVSIYIYNPSKTSDRKFTTIPMQWEDATIFLIGWWLKETQGYNQWLTCHNIKYNHI